ncbi:MAG: 2TM domain-containing protein [Chitinophagaceae bacterium]
MTHLNKEQQFARINLQKGFNIHLLVFLLTIPAIWIIWWLAGTSYPWPIWNTGAWTLGILFHYLGAFVFKKRKNIY